MFDGFWSGIFGGLFGAAMTQWARKYKYWVIFIFVTLGVHACLFLQDLFDVGFHIALEKAAKFTFSPVGFFTPIAIGLLAVGCVFVCSQIAGDK